MSRTISGTTGMGILSALLGKNQGFFERHEGDIGNRSRLPMIRRAREFTLHGQDGKKYLDLYRTDGYSLLGYSVPGLGAAVKARTDQHLWAGMPHHSHRQAEVELSRAFPEYEPFIVANWYTVEFLLKSLGLGMCPGFLPDQNSVWNDEPSTIEGQRGQVSYQVWLPFTPLYADLAFAILPGLGYSGPFVLLIRHELIQSLGLSTDDVAVLQGLRGMVSPLTVAALLHTLPHLRAYEACGVGTGVPELGGRRYEDVLGYWRESMWEGIALGRWKRRGPYLFHGFTTNEYQTVFQFGLRQGIILNPRAEGISILPGLLSKGQQKVLEDVLGFTPELTREP